MILPVRNEEKSIDAALAALAKQTYPSELVEILVVDGESTDATVAHVDAARSRDPRIRLLRNSGRIAPTALNIGIRAAHGNVIARMDGHARARPDYLATGVRLLDSTGAWAVGGEMHKEGTTSSERANAMAASSRFGVGDASHNYANEPYWAETVFLGMWPRWVFERVGLFDEELARDQDDEFSFRIRQAGGRIRFDPGMVVDYTPRSGLRKIFSQYRQYGLWKVRVFQKHPRAVRWRHLVPPCWVATLGAGLLTAPTAIGGRLALAVATIPYLALIIAASALAPASASQKVRFGAAIVSIHFGYGIGFLQGVIRFLPRFFRDRTASAPQLEPLSSAELSTTMIDPGRRHRALGRIRNAYADYARHGRSARWSAREPGARIALDERNQWLAASLLGVRVGLVLDLGCGDGNLALTLRASGIEPAGYVGVDLLPDRLTVARARVPWGSFHEAAADRVPLADSSVDTVVALTMLSSIDDAALRSATAAEIDRVLAPSGRVLIYDIRFPSPTNSRLVRIDLAELRRLFPGWRMLSTSLTLLPPLARTSLASHPNGYARLARLPALRSHRGSVLSRQRPV